MSQDLVLEGRLLQIFEVVTGDGRNGPWERQAFLVEVPGRFPTKVHIDIWGERRSMLSAFKVGDEVRVWIEVSSREYNERWYTSVRAWKMEAVVPAAPSGQEGGDGVPPNAGTVPFDYEGLGSGDGGDDLPF